MPKTLAILAASLVFPALQDEPIELKWNLQKEDKFDLKWTYSDQTRHEMPKLEGRSDAEAIETYDRRDVEAELYLKDNTPAGVVLMTLKKVAWTQGTNEYEVTLGWTEGRKPEPQTRIKVKDKQSNPTKREEVAKSAANGVAEMMKKVVEGAYSLSANAARPGETLVLRNNQAARGNSVFDRMYLQSVAPRGSVNLNQAWKDALEGVQLPPGLVEVDTLSWKIVACGPKTGATAKASFTFPINKSAANTSNNQVTDVRTTGNYALAREYTFAAEGYLSSAKEDISFSKRTDAKGADADFYKDTVSRTLKQVLTVKPKKDFRKPAEEKK